MTIGRKEFRDLACAAAQSMSEGALSSDPISQFERSATPYVVLDLLNELDMLEEEVLEHSTARAADRAEARAEERAAVVAWLRSKDEPTDNEDGIASWLAARIEQGAHVKGEEK